LLGVHCTAAFWVKDRWERHIAFPLGCILDAKKELKLWEVLVLERCLNLRGIEAKDLAHGATQAVDMTGSFLVDFGRNLGHFALAIDIERIIDITHDFLAS
jgi:hypothetical protein